MCNIRVFDMVSLKEKTEIFKGVTIDTGVRGVVTGRSLPNFYLVKFEGYEDVYWVQGSKLIRHN